MYASSSGLVPKAREIRIWLANPVTAESTNPTITTPLDRAI
jgi:hypothetical protein